MKKIILFIIVSLMMASTSFSQVKVTIALGNWGWDAGGVWYLKVWAIIPAGQTWRVGSCNIRVDFVTTPGLKLTVHPDADSVRSALQCINSNGYSKMTTTSINGGTAISLNITYLNATSCCTLTSAGSPYCLGKIRFNKVDTCCSTDTIRHSGPGVSPIYDSLTLLSGNQWAAQNVICIPVGISNYSIDLPTVYKLYDNYPNPFNPMTTIKFDLPRTSYVKMIIYDILGKTVSTLVDEKKDAGRYEIQWNANNYASGTYFYKMETEYFTDVKKMILVK